MTWSLPVINPVAFAAASSAAKTALHQVTDSVQSAPASYAMSSAKVAAAADAVERLAHLVETLRETHGQTVKSAQQLIEAVKLAQQGLIDPSDIFVRAGLEIPDPTVSPIGKLADSRQPESQGEAPKVDQLTSFLRSKR